MAEPKVVQGLWNDAVCLSYMAGKTSEMQLLEQAGEDYVALANAYFTIAMLRLADGNGAEAYRVLREVRRYERNWLL